MLLKNEKVAKVLEFNQNHAPIPFTVAELKKPFLQASQSGYPNFECPNLQVGRFQ